MPKELLYWVLLEICKVYRNKIINELKEKGNFFVILLRFLEWKVLSFSNFYTKCLKLNLLQMSYIIRDPIRPRILFIYEVRCYITESSKKFMGSCTGWHTRGIYRKQDFGHKTTLFWNKTKLYERYFNLSFISYARLDYLKVVCDHG